jgi:hypothetical protein
MHITRRDLYNRVWSTPMSKLARELDISDVGLAKVCRRRNIPRPPRGYWAKLAAGKAPPKTELNRGKLAGLSFLVPPREALNAFDASTLPLRLRLAANSHQAQTLATLRDTLLPRLISGQLRLPEAEALAV